MDSMMRNYTFTVRVGEQTVKMSQVGKTRFLARKDLVRVLNDSHLAPFEILPDEEQSYRVDFTLSLTVNAENSYQAVVEAYDKLAKMLAEGTLSAASFAAQDKVVPL